MVDLKKLLQLDFTKPSRSVIGVDIGSSAIKVVQVRKEKGIAVLETYGALALGPYGDTEIGRAVQLPIDKFVEAMNDLIREANITSKSAGISIPFSSSLLTIVRMPAVETKELNKMVPIEARKYIPVPINEVMLDWFIIPSDRDKERQSAAVDDQKDTRGAKMDSKKEEEPAEAIGTTEVLLVAIHNEVLNNQSQIIKQTKLEADFFEIEIFSSLRAILEQNLTPVMVVDLGAATTKTYIVEYGIVRSSHVINRGSQDITLGISRSLNMSVIEAEETKRQHHFTDKVDETGISKAALLTLDYIFSEANRVLLSYQTKFNRNVGKVILTGGGAVMKGISEIARSRLETEIKLANPFEKVDTPASLEDILEEAGPEFSVAVGLALRELHELEQ